MPAGGFSASSGMDFEAKITPMVITSCVTAATGGLMFGYDIGISGGVTAMEDFQREFFPTVLRKRRENKGSNYCRYNNQVLQLFTSSLYLAGLVSTLFASYTTRRLGRRATMRIAGGFFIVGVVFNGAARNLGMLIVGRILLGCGVGFANQAIPLFLSEVAPTTIRGGLNTLFQLNITIGILFASLVNYGTNNIHPWGWRLSLSLAGFPAMLLTLGALFMVDTPNSLIERGHLVEGKVVLKKIRGTNNVESEFNEIVEASRIAHDVKHPFCSLLQRRNRPLLTITVMLQMFQQLTGINAIMFYAPVLLTTLGFKTEASLYTTVITGAVNVLSTLVSMYTVDRVGRRMLLLDASMQMFLSLVAMAVVMRTKVTDRSDVIDHNWAIMVVIIICNFVSSFSWSWGPLGWLIPSETFPLETRSAGQSICVCTNLLFTFVIAQVFLSMLCHLKSFIFVFFSVCVAIMSLFVLFFLPETKNIPIEKMVERVWKQHWFWKRFMNEGCNNHAISGEGTPSTVSLYS
ncbi:sugar transport protein MST4-like [Hordeum vulgare subsp. vulgare]|uniref:sugar transport protein MST4-like n=1 Tax=Hordeum vulgare subsp. vulgare TaxID=112509 RepID=UPI000B47F407|nr:sugar transport protein MST4-like [Hordeum vulgare subsp. vulgare]